MGRGEELAIIESEHKMFLCTVVIMKKKIWVLGRPRLVRK